MTRPKAKPKLQFCWCFSIPIEQIDHPPPSRPQPRPVQGSAPMTSRPPKSAPPGQHLSPAHQRPSLSGSAGKSSGRLSRHSTSSSQTAHFLSLIQPTTEPTTASALMAELARPYVDSEEPGYIYMFWMTPASEQAAPVEAARSLLAPPSPSPRSRRPSDVVSAFAASEGTGAASKDAPGTRRKKKTMLLKIGRAANVQRRMNQWARQCGYEVEVIRYYPYIPGASEGPGAAPRTTPHCKRVERLVHIELGGMGLRADLDTCKACGKEHREWFEVEATREGVRAVDEVVRRWVGWDESTAS